MRQGSPARVWAGGVFVFIVALVLTGGGPVWCAAAQECSQTVNWAGMKGTFDNYPMAVYGTKGAANPANRPGARQNAVSWTDSSGALWLYGGKGSDLGSNVGFLNDLWKYELGTGNWSWIKGSSNCIQSGVYGTLGTPAANNTPGARVPAAWWTDVSGNLWLFGGANRYNYHFNDLWKYDTATGNWTWIKGASVPNQRGTYGVLGTPAAGNTPGGRGNSVSWTDSSGKFWLFGGFGHDKTGSLDELNDLWKYDPDTGNWTWMKGALMVYQHGNYGVLGTPAAANNPGSRERAVSWTDSSGKLWVFGGYGFACSGWYGYLNDLWKYDPDTGNWTWMKGASNSTTVQAGTKGAMGTAAAANTPGARNYAVSWTDPSGKLWLFGGHTSGDLGSVNDLNDLWKYDPATGNWACMKGTTTVDGPATYGTLRTPASANIPGARDSAVSWTDASGKLWLFGGYGLGTGNPYSGRLNDLWKYDPATGNWTWMKGVSTANPIGTYGTQGVPAPGSTPGSRAGAVSWTDKSGRFWLFGGYGYDSAGNMGDLSDLWQYNPATGYWTWMKGASTINQLGTYGTSGVPAMDNMPGARNSAASWTDSMGKLWLFGGFGYASTGSGGLNDLWRYDPDTGNWAWMKGSSMQGPVSIPRQSRGLYFCEPLKAAMRGR